MKNSIIKRIICMMLSLLLIATITTPAFAYNESAVPTNNVEVYELTLSDNTTSVISVSTKPNGNVQIDVNEGDIHNTITYIGNKMYIDGNEVIISDTIRTSNVTENIAVPASFIPFYTYNNSPMYLTASAYNNPANNTIRNNNLSLGVSWNSLAAGTLAIILADSLEELGLAMLSKYSPLFVGVAEWAIVQGMKMPYQDAYMSYSYILHLPSTQPSNSLHWEVNCNFYTRTNCEGTAYPKVFYEAYYFSA